MGARHKGLSLVELMVALALGTVLSLAVSNLFLRSKISYLQDTQRARLQENGRFALRYLSHELAMAGYLGDRAGGGHIRHATGGTACVEYLLDTTSPLEHYNDVQADGSVIAGNQGIPADCLGNRAYVAGSDMLVLRRSLGSPVVLQGDTLHTPDSDRLYLRVENYSAVASLEAGGGQVDPGVDLWEYRPQIMFLRRYSIKTSDGIPTLCRLRLAPGGEGMAPLECLVEGVQDLQVEFGIDEDGDQLADIYLRSPATGEMGQAVSARLYLLLRSVLPVYGYINRHSYRLGDKLVAPANDAYYRRVMQATVLLRNSSRYRL